MAAGSDTPRPAAGGPPPPALRRAAWLVLAQGFALTALSAWYAVRGLVDEAESVPGTEIAALLGVLAGMTLLVLARGLAGCRGWARAPLIVLELLALPVGLSLLQSNEPLAAAVLIGSVVAVGYALLTPEARQALRE